MRPGRPRSREGPKSNKFQVAGGAALRAFFAAVAEIKLNPVMLPLGQPDEAVVGAISPAGFAIHAHAAGHAAIRFLESFLFRESFLNLPLQVALLHRKALSLMTLRLRIPVRD